MDNKNKRSTSRLAGWLLVCAIASVFAYVDFSSINFQADQSDQQESYVTGETLGSLIFVGIAIFCLYKANKELKRPPKP